MFSSLQTSKVQIPLSEGCAQGQRVATSNCLGRQTRLAGEPLCKPSFGAGKTQGFRQAMGLDGTCVGRWTCWAGCCLGWALGWSTALTSSLSHAVTTIYHHPARAEMTSTSPLWPPRWWLQAQLLPCPPLTASQRYCLVGERKFSLGGCAGLGAGFLLFVEPGCHQGGQKSFIFNIM